MEKKYGIDHNEKEFVLQEPVEVDRDGTSNDDGFMGGIPVSGKRFPTIPQDNQNGMELTLEQIKRRENVSEEELFNFMTEDEDTSKSDVDKILTRMAVDGFLRNQGHDKIISDMATETYLQSKENDRDEGNSFGPEDESRDVRDLIKEVVSDLAYIVNGGVVAYKLHLDIYESLSEIDDNLDQLSTFALVLYNYKLSVEEGISAVNEMKEMLTEIDMSDIIIEELDVSEILKTKVDSIDMYITNSMVNLLKYGVSISEVSEKIFYVSDKLMDKDINKDCFDISVSYFNLRNKYDSLVFEVFGNIDSVTSVYDIQSRGEIKENE